VDARALPSLQPTPTRQDRGLWTAALLRLLENRTAIVGAACLCVLALAGLLAPVVTPYEPTVGDLTQRLQGPSATHLMGTDLLGRDEFTRVLYGARLSLQAGLVAVIFGVGLGGLIGAVAGGVGGVGDAFLMRVTDVMLAFPGVLLAIGIVSWLGQGSLQIMVAVGVSYAPTFARLLRGSVLALRQTEYVAAARAIGATGPRVLMRHMLPNALTPVIVRATLALATAIIDVAALGFLGLGPGDPRIAEWGEMLTDSARFLQTAPHLILFPSAAIIVTAVAINLLGDGLRDSLDPRSSL
jgi:peptide/nickel transport system permease protein